MKEPNRVNADRIVKLIGAATPIILAIATAAGIQASEADEVLKDLDAAIIAAGGAVTGIIALYTDWKSKHS